MAPTQALKPGHFKDNKVAALFSTKDPEARFDDLKEIGHGSFGAVFYAFDRDRGETVAIKKMSYSGKQATEKWADVIKEVTFLTSLNHRNIVEYRLSYLKDHTCWLVMEYCIGSAADLVDVLRTGLREVEIAAIMHSTLEALAYLHSLSRIHRDVKAANILLTDNGIVKLADFGSASMACPASTFIGTPFFMAPEVILAMDDGDYCEKADIWSVGITSIELAERRPPLFNMNAMSALYHIAQNEPPTLTEAQEWSECFKDFVAACLRKDPTDRMGTNQAKMHEFVRDACAPPVLCELIARTKRLVRELEHSQYRKMRKLMYLDEANANDEGSDEVLGDSVSTGDGGESMGTRAGADSPSSRSASLNSSHSIQSGSKHYLEKPTIVSVSEEEPKEPAPPVDMERGVRNIKDDVATLRKSKFSTLRTTKVISKEEEEYKKENNMHEQMSGYKRLRQNHHKEIIQLEERLRGDGEGLRLRLEREVELAMGAASKEKARLRERHAVEMERRKKEVDDGERRLRKHISAKQQTELKNYVNCQLKEYKHNKEMAKRGLKDRGASKNETESAMRDVKASLAREKDQAERRFHQKLRAEAESELAVYRKTALARTHDIENRIDAEEGELEMRLADAREKLLWAQHEQTAEQDTAQLRELAEARSRHQKAQHDAETANQAEYERRRTEQLSKQHAMQSKQQPRELKMKEQMIRKQYRQAVKTQTRQFKLWQTQLMAAAARDEQKEIVARLKDEQKRKLAILGVQYENQIESMVQEKTGKLEAWQEEEAKSLAEELSKESKELAAYQGRQQAQLEATAERERIALEEKKGLRKALLQQRLAEYRAELLKQSSARDDNRRRRHEKEDNALQPTATTTAL